MSANLSKNKDGKVEMFSGSGVVPWHGEGTIIQGRANAAEALTLAGLNWKVGKVPIFFNNNETGSIFDPCSIPEKYITRRLDKTGQDSILGVVGEQYTIVDNVDCFKFFDSVVDKNEAIYESAGALGKGERVWILAKLPDQIKLNGSDIIDKYLLLATSHDGTMNLTAKLTAVRVVCQNTLRAAIAEKGETIRIRHTATAQERVDEAAKIMGLANEKFDQTKKLYGALVGIKFTTQMLDYFLISCIPSHGENPTRAANIRSDIRELIEGVGLGADLPTAKGTAWGLYNGVTEYVSHVKGYKEGTSMLDALWFGSGANTSGRALEVAYSLPNVKEDVMAKVIRDEAEKMTKWENRE